MRKKVALITGITGQDGAYLASFLIEKGYEVHGLRRRSSTDNTVRLQRIPSHALHLHYGDLTDACSLFQLLQSIQPTEIYNLAAQSDVAISFENPLYTADVDALGTLRLLEAIRILKLDTRFYQASTSELFGDVREVPQKETTPFYPRSPYAAAKLYAYWITVNYREAYGLFACNGILFNHESPERAENFVTRKITKALGRIALGLQTSLYLGNLSALRDWGHTQDFIEMQWAILQEEHPNDYVIATGKQHSVKQFVELSSRHLGIELRWEGVGIEEKGIVVEAKAYPHLKPGTVIIQVDPAFFRPTEVETLLGDPSKAKNKLGWEPKISFEELVKEMTQKDLERAHRELTACS